jgi:hypothetical protein
MSYSVNELTHVIIHQKELKVSLRRGMHSKKSTKNSTSISPKRQRIYRETEKHNMRHIKLYEDFNSLNEDKFRDNLNGYVMFLNKDKQAPSGFTVGDKVEFDFKKTDGTVVQTVPGVVEEVLGEPADKEAARNQYDYPVKNWAVVVRASNSLWQFGSDSSRFQSSLEDLRKV